MHEMAPLSLREDHLVALQRLSRITGEPVAVLVSDAIDEFLCGKAGQATVAAQAAIIAAKTRGETPLTTDEVAELTQHGNRASLHTILTRLHRSDTSGVTHAGYRPLGHGRKATLWDWQE